MGKRWSQKEMDYLEESWGNVSIKTIAKNLDRSISSILNKATKMKLGDPILSYDGITIFQLSEALNISYSSIKYWIKKYKFPAKKKLFTIYKRVLVIRYDDFWKWAENNKHIINLSRLEPGILGLKPEWAKEKRKADFLNYNKQLERPWSKKDDSLLRSMVSAYRYTYPEIAEALKRTEGAVKRRLYDLGIKARPIRRNNHIKYTEEEVRQLVSLYESGYGFNTIAEKLGKSALGVRGKLERMGYRFRKVD